MLSFALFSQPDESPDDYYFIANRYFPPDYDPEERWVEWNGNAWYIPYDFDENGYITEMDLRRMERDRRAEHNALKKRITDEYHGTPASPALRWLLRNPERRPFSMGSADANGVPECCQVRYHG